MSEEEFTAAELSAVFQEVGKAIEGYNFRELPEAFHGLARLVLRTRKERDAALVRLPPLEERIYSLKAKNAALKVSNDSLIEERATLETQLRLYRAMAPQAIVNQVEPERARPLAENKRTNMVNEYVKRIAVLEAENAELKARLGEPPPSAEYVELRLARHQRIAENERLRVAFESVCLPLGCEADCKCALRQLLAALEGKSE